jgi:hypothetical protein
LAFDPVAAAAIAVVPVADGRADREAQDGAGTTAQAGDEHDREDDEQRVVAAIAATPAITDAPTGRRRRCRWWCRC